MAEITFAMAQYLEAVIGGLEPGDWPNYIQAIETLAADAEATYKGYLLGKDIPGKGALKRPTGGLAKAAFRRQDGLLLWSVGNASDYANGIEEGQAEYDMKQNLATAPKARRAKDGTLYLIIPFRHGIPGTRGMNAMPRAVYAQAMKLKHSKALGAPSTRESATGYTVPKFMYSWRGKVSAKQIENMKLDEETKPHWKASRYAGMVRMGKKGHTTYLTFRIMSQKSKGWIRPATPGMAPLTTALEVAWSEGQPAIEAALQSDIEAILQ